MPTNPTILGFAKPCHQSALDQAANASLPGGGRIRMATPLYFLATKLTAFNSAFAGAFWFPLAILGVH
jgi:hypothetical protein